MTTDVPMNGLLGNDASAFAMLLEASPHAFALLDRDHVIQAVGAAYLDMTDASESDLVGRSIYDAFPDNPDDVSGAAEMMRVSLDRVLATGERDELEFRHPIPVRDTPGRFVNHWWGVVNTALRRDGEVVGVLHRSVDISERVLAERDARIRERIAGHIWNLAYWEFTPSEGTAVIAPALTRLFELPESNGRTAATPYLERYVPEDRERHMAEFEELEDAPAGTPIEGEYRMSLPEAGLRWLHVRGELVRENPHDPATFIGVGMDVTRAKARETDLAEAVADRERLLDQKEVLLGEVHHRIKNSLQLVSSILSLDAATPGEVDARERLRRAGARVMAVASVHELIYRSGQVATVDLDGYLVDLCRSLGASVQGTVSCRAVPVRLDTDHAISLALMVNELVANAFGHGLRDRSDGHVEVTCDRDGDELVLRVADNGSGKPVGGRQGLGTRIIDAMVSQLDATMTEGPARDANGDETNGGAMEPGHEVTVRIPYAA